MLIAHEGLSRATLIFTAIVGLWALYAGIRNRPLDSRWLGSAVICEILIVVQSLVGVWLWVGTDWSLPRPFLHVLYGIVGIIALPAAYGYLSRLPDSRAIAWGMTATCTFLFFALLRAIQVAYPMQ